MARYRESKKIGVAIMTQLMISGDHRRWLDRELPCAQVDLTLETKRRWDDDNVTASLKGLIDCLRAATPSEQAARIKAAIARRSVSIRLGIIEGDSPDQVHVTYAQEQSTGRTGVRIVITPL